MLNLIQHLFPRTEQITGQARNDGNDERVETRLLSGVEVNSFVVCENINNSEKFAFYMIEKNYICAMAHTTHSNRTIHEGRNLKRFREMLGIKQDALAADLGDDWNQQKISLLEQKETIDAPLLQQISAVLKIPVEAIQNFDEEQAVNVISNTFGDHGVGYQRNENCSFNPIDKMVELYERMLQQQREMIEKLERLIERK